MSEQPSIVSRGLLPPEIEAVSWSPVEIDILDGIWQGRGGGVPDQELCNYCEVSERSISAHLNRIRKRLPDTWAVFVENRRYTLVRVSDLVADLPEELREIRWSHVELQILAYVARHRFQHVLSQELATEIYALDPDGGPDGASRVVDVRITNIRKKLVGTGWMLDDRRNLVRGDQEIRKTRNRYRDGHRRKPFSVQMRADFAEKVRSLAEAAGEPVGAIVERALEQTYDLR